MSRFSPKQLDDIKSGLMNHVGKGNALDTYWMQAQCVCAPTRQLLFDAASALGGLQYDLVDARQDAVKFADEIEKLRDALKRILDCDLENVQKYQRAEKHARQLLTPNAKLNGGEAVRFDAS